MTKRASHPAQHLLATTVRPWRAPPFSTFQRWLHRRRLRTIDLSKRYFAWWKHRAHGRLSERGRTESFEGENRKVS